MTDPKNSPESLATLAEETKDPFEQALLREAKDVRASDDTRRATLAALGLPPAPTGGASASGGSGLAAKVAVGALGLVVVGIAGWLALGGSAGSDAGPSPSATAAVHDAPLASAAPPVLSPSPSASASVAAAPGASAPVATASASALAPPSGHATKPVPPQPSASGGTFADEVRLIDQARKAVYDRDKEAALRALDEYDRRFPPSHPGQMAADAAALRVRARAL